MRRNYLSIAVLTIILVIGTFIRFTKLGVIPPGLTDDEAVKGYDAYSLLRTGRDEWGVPWPLLSFKGFGDYRTPLYTYLAIPPIKYFGLTPFAVRFPSALLGSLTIIALYFFVFELFHGRKNIVPLALLSALFLAISPWHVGMSRIGHEVTVAVFIVLSGLTALLAARRNSRLFSVAGIFFGLGMYVYPAATFFVPAIVTVCLILFRKDFPITSYKPLIAMVIIVILISIPTITVQSVRLRQVNLTQDSGTIDLLNTKRGDCVTVFPPQLCRIVQNKYYIFFEKLATNYIYHFSPSLLVISGSTTQYSILPPGGLLYLVELPLLLVGLITVLRFRNAAGIFLVLYLFISAIPDSVTGGGHYGRYFISIPVWQILTAFGVYAMAVTGKRYRILLLGIGILYILECANFAVGYTTYFPREYSVYSHFGYKELVENIELNKPQYDKILVSGRVNDSKQYIFYLFYTRFDPNAFQSGKTTEKGLDSLGWVWVKRIGNVYFVADLPTVDKQTNITDRELFIAAPSEFPKLMYIPTQFVIKDKKGDTLFQAVDGADYIRCVRTICTAGNI